MDRRRPAGTTPNPRKAYPLAGVSFFSFLIIFFIVFKKELYICAVGIERGEWNNDL